MNDYVGLSMRNTVLAAALLVPAVYAQGVEIFSTTVVSLSSDQIVTFVTTYTVTTPYSNSATNLLTKTNSAGIVTGLSEPTISYSNSATNLLTQTNSAGIVTGLVQSIAAGTEERSRSLDSSTTNVAESGGDQSSKPTDKPTPPSQALQASQNNSSRLSTGAKAGIGVGVSIAGIAIAALLVWFLRRYNLTLGLTKKASTQNQAADADVEKRGYRFWSEILPKAELDRDGETLEIENTARPHEADDRNVRSELEGDEPVGKT